MRSCSFWTFVGLTLLIVNEGPLHRVLGLSSELGIHAVEVDALDEAAAAFYRKYGFTPLIDDPLHLYLPIATLEEVLG